MIIDTLALLSPLLSLETISKMQKGMIKRSAIEIETGQIKYEVLSGQIEQSWDTSIRVNIWKSQRVRIECSVNKLLLGHNLWGGFDSILASAKYVIKRIEEGFNISLPDAREWDLQRVDMSDNYELGSESEVLAYINCLKSTKLGKRESSWKSSVSSLSRRGGITVYAKGPEFLEHDWKMLKKYEEFQGLDKVASKLLRVEVRARAMQIAQLTNQYKELDQRTGSRTLDIIAKRAYNNKTSKRLADIDENLIKEWMISQREKMVGKVFDDMKIANKDREVLQRLNGNLKKRLARSVYATWYQLATVGYNETKESMSRTTFHYHIKHLEKCGITWVGSNIHRTEYCIFPADFSIASEKYLYNRREQWTVDLQNELLSA